MTKKHARSRSKRKHNTKRRTRSRTRSRVKRGGMFRRTPRNIASIFINQKVLPLITEYEYRVGALNPQPTDGVVTPHRLKYYNSFKDIPVDDGIKRSIIELKQELNNPVKDFDKLLTAYKNATEKIEDDKRKMNKGNPTPSPQFIRMGSPFMLRKSVLLQSTTSMVDSPRNEIPQTPNTKLKPEYSTDSNTPIKLLSKGSLRSNGDGDADDGDADYGDNANVSKVLFGDDIRSPPQSPVPMSPSSIKNSSPFNSPVRRLVL